MAGIRINSGIRKIEVNDNGDTISLRSDMEFIKKMKDFIDDLGTIREDVSRKVEFVAKDDKDGMLSVLYEVHKELHDRIDSIFGANTCKKVFGDGVDDVIPTIDLVADFLTQITPFYEDLMKEQARKNTKYSASRVGSGR